MAERFVVIGAGIMGLAVAWELKKQFPTSSITVLEKERKPGQHASGRNSGVLHSGIYYPKDSLKSRVCASGASLMLDFAREHKIAFVQGGKVILACDESELPALATLEEQAQINNIPVERLDEKGVREKEPHAGPAAAALFCPTTAVIDTGAVLTQLETLLREKGVVFEFQAPVCQVNTNEKIVKTTSQQTHSYDFVFNCAGAHCDRVARLFGLGQGYRVLPFKGLYYKLPPERAHLVTSNIYPVPNLAFPFLGVHLTRSVQGEVYVGPTAIPAFGRENYKGLTGLKGGEMISVLTRLLGLYWANQKNFRALVHQEAGKILKTRFLTHAQKLVPTLQASDLRASSKVGIRPQLVDEAGALQMDYILEKNDQSLHVLNAISPAFTSAFAFSKTIVDQSFSR